MCEIEASLNTQGDAAKESILSKVVDYVKKLRNIVAPGEDSVTSPLFNECSVVAC
jgi:hypothetical protein